MAEALANGLTYKQTGERLGISYETVATHIDNIRDKLGVRSKLQIALWFLGQS